MEQNNNSYPKEILALTYCRAKAANEAFKTVLRLEKSLIEGDEENIPRKIELIEYFYTQIKSVFHDFSPTKVKEEGEK